MHGIHVGSDCCLAEMQFLVLRHLLIGDCVRTHNANSTLPVGARQDIVCGQLSTPFSSATDMSVSFIRRVVDDLSDHQKLNGARLSAIGSALSNTSFSTQPFSTPSNVRRDILRLLKRFLSVDTHDDLHLLPSGIEHMTKSELQSVAHNRRIHFQRNTTVSDLRDLVVGHVVSAQCFHSVDLQNWDASPSGCASSIRLLLSEGREPNSAAFIVFTLSHCARSMSLKPLRRVFRHLDIPFDSNDSLNQLRRRLNAYVAKMRKALISEGSDLSWSSICADLVETREQWPQLISASSKDKIHDDFLKLTAYDALKSGVCAACSESSVDRSLSLVPATSIDLDLLRRPDAFELDLPVVEPWLDPNLPSPDFPFSQGPLADVLVDPKGVTGQGLETKLVLCKHCLSSLKRGHIPDLALSNHMFIGNVPPELRDLTVVEESMISLCRSKCCIV